MTDDVILYRVAWLSADKLTGVAERVADSALRSFISAEPITIKVGERLLAREDGSGGEVPADFPWGKPEVGVVVRRDDANTVVDVDGKLRTLPTNSALNYAQDYTVEVEGRFRVARVILDQPLNSSSGLRGRDPSLAEFEVDPALLKDSFDALGGYDYAKKKAREFLDLAFGSESVVTTMGVTPVRGMLFTGPSGTGKTYLARIMAREAGAAFFQVAGPSLMSKFVSESEETLRRLYAAAKSKSRAIIFFDEFDSIARPRSADTHGHYVSMVSQLLAMFDGFEEDTGVAFIAATNRPEFIDSALRREGRFDWIIPFHLPDANERLKILEATSVGKSLERPIDWEPFVQRTEGWSPAKIKAIWQGAAIAAIDDGRKVIGQEDLWIGVEAVRVGHDDTASELTQS